MRALITAFIILIANSLYAEEGEFVDTCALTQEAIEFARWYRTDAYFHQIIASFIETNPKYAAQFLSEGVSTLESKLQRVEAELNRPQSDPVFCRAEDLRIANLGIRQVTLDVLRYFLKESKKQSFFRASKEKRNGLKLLNSILSSQIKDLEKKIKGNKGKLASERALSGRS